MLLSLIRRLASEDLAERNQRLLARIRRQDSDLICADATIHDLLGERANAVHEIEALHAELRIRTTERDAARVALVEGQRMPSGAWGDHGP